MKQMIAVVLGGLMLLSGADAMAQQTEGFRSYIAVTGTAEREVTPNEIYIEIRINERDNKNGKTTVSEQERDMIKMLRGLGIDTERDLKVEDISGSLRTYALRRNRVLTEKTYTFKVGDAQTLGAVFEGLSEIGISQAYLTKAVRSDMKELRNELRAEAMKNARETAEILASAIGQTVGKAQLIIDNNYYDNGVVYYRQNVRLAAARGIETVDMAADEDVFDDAVAIDFKSIKINSSVRVEFALE